MRSNTEIDGNWSFIELTKGKTEEITRKEMKYR